MNRSDLHDYQCFCVEFVKEHPESMLILEMGLGKSVISLTAILDLMFDRFEVGKVLVIAPLRVANTVWPEEHQKWSHVAFLRMSVMTGSRAERIAALNTEADIYVINRENVSWLVEYLGKMKKPWPFDMVVIDELSSFKSRDSRRFQALRKVRPFISRIVGLTGTPAGNGLLDLWAETYLIDRGERLGRFIVRYRDIYFTPASKNPYTGQVYSYVPRPGAEQEIFRRISDIVVSMKSMDYLDIPECVMVSHPVEMDEGERKVYNSLKQEFILQLEGETIDAANAAVLSNKLLQLANGAIYTDSHDCHSYALRPKGLNGRPESPPESFITVHSRKLDMLEDLIEQANGQHVLIAFWFRHDRDRIMQRLRERGYHPRELKTSLDIVDWNAGDIPVALISPASAGHGLNIQKGGHILIWFSMIWSLEQYLQTNARLWRQGQQDVVTIHHIVMKDTIDETVMKALERKDTTQQALIEAVKAQIISTGNSNTDQSLLLQNV